MAQYEESSWIVQDLWQHSETTPPRCRNDLRSLWDNSDLRLRNTSSGSWYPSPTHQKHNKLIISLAFSSYINVKAVFFKITLKHT